MDSRAELNALKRSKPALKGLSIVYVDEKRGHDHAQEWHTTCHLGGYSMPSNRWHTNRHDAREDAASSMILYINTGGAPKDQSDSMDDIIFTKNNPSPFTAPSNIGHQPLNSRNSSPEVPGERHLLYVEANTRRGVEDVSGLLGGNILQTNLDEDDIQQRERRKGKGRANLTEA